MSTSNDVSRRRLLQTAGAAAAGFTLAQAPIASGRITVREAKPTVRLKMWSHEGDVAKYLNRRIKELNAKSSSKYSYAPIEITVLAYADISTKALAAFSARKNVPDILGTEINHFSRYMKVAPRVFADLTGRLGAARSQFFQSDLAAYSVNGRVYGFEIAHTLMAWWYRADLYRELGIRTIPATWEELVAVGRRVAKPKGKYLSTLATGGGGQSGDLSGQFTAFLLQRGGDAFDDKGNVTLDSREAVEVLTFMYKGLQDGVFLDVSALFGPADVASMKTERVISHEGADWWKFMITRNLTDQMGKWRIAPLPAFARDPRKRRTSKYGGTGYAITTASKNQDAAWELFRYAFVTDHGQTRRYFETGFLPTKRSAYNSKRFLEFRDPALGGQQPVKEVWRPLSGSAPTQRQNPKWSISRQAMSTAVAEVFAGRKNPTEALREAAEKVRKARA